MQNEVTSEVVGKIAARGLRNPASLSLEEIKMVCASALTQRPDRAQPTSPAPEPVKRGFFARLFCRKD